MSVRRQRNQGQHWNWINRWRFYNYDTTNSDFRKPNGERVQMTQSAFRSAAVRFDKQFTEPAETYTEYSVIRRNGKYIVELA